MTIQPRLLPDFAAAPTPRERAASRAHWHAAQASLDLEQLEQLEHLEHCAACTSTDHLTDRCPHGTALALDLTPEGDTPR